MRKTVLHVHLPYALLDRLGDGLSGEKEKLNYANKIYITTTLGVPNDIIIMNGKHPYEKD